MEDSPKPRGHKIREQREIDDSIHETDTVFQRHEARNKGTSIPNLGKKNLANMQNSGNIWTVSIKFQLIRIVKMLQERVKHMGFRNTQIADAEVD